MEINPFHNGHKYFLDKIRKKHPNDFIIVVISTTISQRGEFSVLSKKIKTEILLENGADLVVELPTICVNQGGEYFAFESVKALDLLYVDLLIFGSESNDKKMLENFNVKKSSFKLGINKNLDKIKSNDILGISYVNAIKKLGSKMEFETIKRKGSDYNSTVIDSNIISATAIRNNYSKDIEKFLDQKAYKNIYFLDQKIFINLLKTRLINLKKQEEIFLSEDGELINRVLRFINKEYNSLFDLAKICSNKNNSKYKFMRLFINVIFDIRNNDKKEMQKNNKYKVLGFNKKYSKFIKNNKNLFLTYKDAPTTYLINDRVDKTLEVYFPNLIKSIDNYNKPIIK